MASNAAPTTHAVFALITRKPGTSFEEFKDYYENKHIPWVNKLIGCEKYMASWTRNYFHRTESEAETLRGYGKNEAGTWDFDVITEIKPKSQELLAEMWEKFKEVQHEIAEDEARFSDRLRSKSYFVADVQGGKIE